MSTERSSDQAGQVYDGVSPIADAFGDGQFHLSYWYGENDETPFVEAAERITRKVADALGLRAGDRVLDAGCGPGATAILMAKETGASFTGVSISKYEVAEAERRAKEAGLADLLKFEQGDYMALPYEDGSFDAVVAIESLLCAPDLGHVLREFHRLLRPGGVVALCHCTLEAPMEPELNEQFLASIMATKLPTLPEWIGALTDAGFAVEEYTQCGPRVFGMRDKYIEAATSRHDLLVSRSSEQAVTYFKAGLEKFFAPGPGHVGYAIVAGRKPHPA
jgi:ubiquinone/menaquinone biosynthesis C-methylase UbiE